MTGNLQKGRDQLWLKEIHKIGRANKIITECSSFVWSNQKHEITNQDKFRFIFFCVSEDKTEETMKKFRANNQDVTSWCVYNNICARSHQIVLLMQWLHQLQKIQPYWRKRLIFQGRPTIKKSIMWQQTKFTNFPLFFLVHKTYL